MRGLSSSDLPGTLQLGAGAHAGRGGVRVGQDGGVGGARVTDSSGYGSVTRSVKC